MIEKSLNDNRYWWLIILAYIDIFVKYFEWINRLVFIPGFQDDNPGRLRSRSGPATHRPHSPTLLLVALSEPSGFAAFSGLARRAPGNNTGRDLFIWKLREISL
jgi:hypothetical protein